MPTLPKPAIAAETLRNSSSQIHRAKHLCADRVQCHHQKADHPQSLDHFLQKTLEVWDAENKR